ncbi:unnamed protein product [Ilex paraguariensis]|uniref:Rad21/Rec8-like protein N-terminal domain-containing protein n=1 Tax=Ilex paraguariensis TaxID=185542 RepID=A0ABC8QTJ9_9AQUA
MFYSHQLLARKAPLGQIWMAATMHAKMNRRKLDKLNIIKICEQILNPSVPMALRLSGILMDDVTRLLVLMRINFVVNYHSNPALSVEINEAWKVKAAPDPTVLPKGKSQAKSVSLTLYEAVTLPENQEADLGEFEQSLQYSNASTMMGFQQTSYIAMADTDYNRFERFDIEGDEDTQVNFHPQENTQFPSTIIPSPPLQEPRKPDEILEQHPEDQVNQQSDEGKETNQPQQDIQRQGTTRRRAKRPAAFAMDYEQTIIPGPIYQSWLQNASDMVSRRGRKRKVCP